MRTGKRSSSRRCRSGRRDAWRSGFRFSWGSGTITYKGKKHSVTVEGLSVSEVGITRATARGNVYDLKKIEDFSGNYTATEAGATLDEAGARR